MKNISDLALLMVIAFVFLLKKPHAMRNMQHIWIWGIFKTRFEMLCFGYGSRWGTERMGAQPLVGLGQGGMRKVPNTSQHSRARGRAMGSSQAHLGSPCSRYDSWQPWGNMGIVHKQVRQLHTGKPREKPSRGPFPNLGRTGIRNLSLTNPWSVPPNKLTGVQDTAGS